MSKVVLENIYKNYSPDTTILKRINLTVEEGEFMVLVGPSGCGKSTLLRIIAGLEEVTAGNISIGDRIVNKIPPKSRDIAMVFQSYALYPHLSVYDNIAFGLRRIAHTNHQKLNIKTIIDRLLYTLTRYLPRSLHYTPSLEKNIQQKVLGVSKLLELETLLDRYPKQLSGGQRQRVALGRAIARNPQVFLMDEPLSNLDAKLRASTRTQIVKLQQELGVTTIYVTHDQIEAMTMGTRIAVMNQGQIQQVASPLELYHQPINRFVAEFIGTPPMNFFNVQVKNTPTITKGEFRYTLPNEWKNTLSKYEGHNILLGIRPEHLNISAPATKNIEVTVELIEALGYDTYINVVTTEHNLPLTVRVTWDKPIKIGDQLWLSLNPDKIHLFDSNTEQALIKENNP